MTGDTNGPAREDDVLDRAKRLKEEAIRVDGDGDHAAAGRIGRELIELAERHELPLHFLTTGLHFAAESERAQGLVNEARRRFERMDEVMGGANWRSVEPDRSANDRVFHARTLYRLAAMAFETQDASAGVEALRRSVAVLQELVEEHEANRAHGGLPLAHFAADLAHVQTQLSPTLATGVKISFGQDPTRDPDFEDPRPSYRLAIETAERQIEADLEGAEDLHGTIAKWGSSAGKYCGEVGWLDDATWFLVRGHDHAVAQHERAPGPDTLWSLATTTSLQGYVTAQRGDQRAAARWFDLAIGHMQAWGAATGESTDHTVERWRAAQREALENL
jgi:hypothetical protein